MDRSLALKSIAAEAARGELIFPTSLAVALKVKEALDDPGCHIDAAARLVQSEPLLAARVVAIANSVAYNPLGREIAQVGAAVSRLGFSTLRSLATALAARQMAGPVTRPEHRAMADQLWEHTTQVAALARVIARRITHQDPETALFAGIVHEAGSFYMLSRVEDFPGLLEGNSQEDDENSEAEVGRAVLKALSVPAAVTSAMEDFWHGYLALPPASLADTLLLADYLAPVKSPLHQTKEGAAELGAVIDVTLGQETLASILKESAEEVQSLVGALRF
ncbi:MAG: putative signal transduction protein [Rhodocyclaceae bacterium]|nr:putative signal transduction protein [Rhodocyclaceae bacterium]